MSFPLLTRVLRPSSAVSVRTTSSPFICNACSNARYQSTYRRTRKALRVKPHASFLPANSTEPADHIIFNPPSSAPSVYHTPAKFLPASDPRRQIPRASTPASLSTSQTDSASAVVLPAVRAPYQKKYHLTAAEVEEMRSLRASDPTVWTRVRLAEKFECSPFFVSLCCSAPKEVHEQQAKDLAEVKKRWGRRKVEAREARVERKKGWGMDA
ncbi:Hypothetical protein R9X50_00468900 [Acrodontium crateriforme]|uniref:Uncharacterized protein n=1 Tax=Acrodontium crateriforme TaxID=150365 RepID=A0AAQ3M6N0_9PEZI|nr:Hypothetical protein R9X50_00468900 [Acrodontium crateriforme]